MLNISPKPEVCDARADATCTTAGLKKNMTIYEPGHSIFMASPLASHSCTEEVMAAKKILKPAYISFALPTSN